MTASDTRGALTSHVLDTALGQPARDVLIRVEARASGGGADASGWTVLGQHTTDADGRVRDLLGGQRLQAQTYRLTFETGAYFRAAGRPVFYPRVQVEIDVDAASAVQHHHIPLLLSPFGYSTYRGS